MEAPVKEDRLEIAEWLRTLDFSDLSYLLGRYCGPSNQILSEKKFGYIMPKELVEQEISRRAVDDFLLS